MQRWVPTVAQATSLGGTVSLLSLYCQYSSVGVNSSPRQWPALRAGSSLFLGGLRPHMPTSVLSRLPRSPARLLFRLTSVFMGGAECVLSVNRP